MRDRCYWKVGLMHLITKAISVRAPCRCIHYLIIAASLGKRSICSQLNLLVFILTSNCHYQKESGLLIIFTCYWTLKLMNPRPFKCAQKLVWKIGGKWGGGWRNDFIKRTICLDKGKKQVHFMGDLILLVKTTRIPKAEPPNWWKGNNVWGCPADQHWPQRTYGQSFP